MEAAPPTPPAPGTTGTPGSPGSPGSPGPAGSPGTSPGSTRAGTSRPAGASPGAGRASTRRDRRSRDRRRRRNRVTLAVVVVLALALVPAAISFVEALTAPGTDRLSARAVEWMRDHGFGPTVNSVERFWFTKHAPPKGGTPEGGLPSSKQVAADAVGSIPTDYALLVGATTATMLPSTPRPTDMQPFVETPLAGEGAWQPTGRAVAGTPAVYTAFMRPDPIHTSLVAGFMWMDPKLLQAVHVPGLKEPAGAPQKYGAQLPNELRASAVAAFNGPFRLDDSRGGYWADGTEVRKLVDGQASLVVDKDGKIDVVAWGRDRQLDANVAQVRQNLALLIDNGQSAAGLDSEATSKWGATVGNQVLVWRSGVGVDRNGGLIYIGGPGLSVNQLAELFLRAGAVRAMELDINHDWVTAYTFDQTDPGNPSAITGVPLLPTMSRGGDRYLVPGERDFVAMVARY